MIKFAIVFLIGTAFGGGLSFIFLGNNVMEGDFVAGMIHRLKQEKSQSQFFIEGTIETPYIGAIGFMENDRSVFTLAHKISRYPKVIIEHNDNTITLVLSEEKDISIKFNPEDYSANFLSITIGENDGTKRSFVDRGVTGKIDETFIFSPDGSFERIKDEIE